ncbi:tyrosine-type recombinase/integrase [Adlercreutzia caecimuris]|uniref:tyrosine-type recombinase/integrase n=1 Tax=Adlercreutzia caecimuris TaxID=671266 RepID=UPI00272ABCAD|nr:site-specific integrase [Adlercreutzia caecimuris]
MAKGDGGIQQLGRDKWRVFVDAGKDPVTEKRRRVTRTVNGSKADARRVRDQIRRELESGIKVDADKITFSDFVVLYCSARETAGKVKPSTLKLDRSRLEFVGDIVGNARLRAIDAQAIESLYAEIRKRRLAQGYGCGNTTLHAYHVLLKAFFKKAVDYDFIMRNPCDRVEAPKIDAPDRKSLTADEAAHLLNCIDEAEAEAYGALLEKESRQEQRGNTSDRSYLLGVKALCCVLAVRDGLATGMRLSEVLRLCWGDVDFVKGSFRVEQSKTKAGVRTISVDTDTMRHLLRWRRIQCDLLATIGVEQNEETPVHCDSVGHRLNIDNFEKWWRSFREDNGFPGLKFHELRHTQATLLLAQGVDVKTVQTRLGHSRASTTTDFYAHAVPENDQKAAQLIGDLFRQKPRQAKIIPMPKTA